MKAVNKLMSQQDGVVTLAQARSAGMSSSAVDRRVLSGEWTRLKPGIFLRADRETTPSVRLRAAVYGAGQGAVAYGPSAAWWYGLIDRPPGRHWVTIPTSRRLERSRPIRLRHRDLHAEDLTSVRGLPVTRKPLAVLEAATELRDGSVLMDRALQRHVTLSMLERVHRRNLPRSGASRAAELLHVAGEGGASEAERIFHRMLRESGIGGWSAHVSSCGFEIDVAFVAARIAIEIDGWAWHRDAERATRDAERQNILVNHGWRVLRFTWHHLTIEPDLVLAEVVAALERV